MCTYASRDSYNSYCENEHVGENRKLYLDILEEATGTGGEHADASSWMREVKKKSIAYAVKVTGLQLQRFADVDVSNYNQHEVRVLVPIQAKIWPDPDDKEWISDLCHGRHPYPCYLNEPVPQEFCLWLSWSCTKVMLEQRKSYARLTDPGLRNLINLVLDQLQIALERVVDLWSPGSKLSLPDKADEADEWLGHRRDETQELKEMNWLSGFCISLVFDFLALSSDLDGRTARFSTLKKMTDQNMEDFYEQVHPFINWDTYDLPDPMRKTPSELYSLGLNSFCNADLRELAGRNAMNDFSFSAFDGAREVPFSAGVVLLHVDKVCIMILCTISCCVTYVNRD